MAPQYAIAVVDECVWLTGSLSQAVSDAGEGHSLVLGDSHFAVTRLELQDEIRRLALLLVGQVELEDPLIPWQLVHIGDLWAAGR